MKPKTRVLQVRRFGRAGESVTHGDRRKRELVFEGPFPPLTARPNQRRAGAVGLTGGASPLGGSPTGHKNQGYILTPVGHPFITHPARRFAPITVRQDWNAVRQELEQVSDSVGIRKNRVAWKMGRFGGIGDLELSGGSITMVPGNAGNITLGTTPGTGLIHQSGGRKIGRAHV